MFASSFFFCFAFVLLFLPCQLLLLSLELAQGTVTLEKLHRGVWAVSVGRFVCSRSEIRDQALVVPAVVRRVSATNVSLTWVGRKPLAESVSPKRLNGNMGSKRRSVLAGAVGFLLLSAFALELRFSFLSSALSCPSQTALAGVLSYPMPSSVLHPAVEGKGGTPSSTSGSGENRSVDATATRPSGKPPVTAADVAFVASPDLQEKYLVRSVKWLRSLRYMGGSLSNATAVLMFPSAPPGSFVKATAKYNPLIRVTGTVEGKCKPTHKVNVFKLEELAAFRFVIVMDCDTVFLRDIAPELNSMTCDSVYAAPTNGAIRSGTRLNMLNYSREALAISLPWHHEETRCKHISPPEESRNQPDEFPYFNAGMIIIPQSLFRPITRLWHYYNDFMAANGEGWFCDQASLTLALAALDVPYNYLPDTLNVPFIQVPHTDLGDVAVLHYHKNEGGRSGEWPLPPVDGQLRRNLQRYNEMVREHPDEYLTG
ncbi:hypothetical protein QOT17_024474 [Balamuthia mandrillaris]